VSPVSTDISIDELQTWVGRVENAFDSVTPQLAQRLAATVESPRGNLAKGQVLPQGWYSVLFPRVVPRSQVGGDGHPALGDFLPPVPLPKRMFAGKRIRFAAPILVGDELERTSEIASIVPKQGSSGPLVFVTIRHTVQSGAGVVIVEDQDVVYRSADSGGRKATAPAPAAAPAPTSDSAPAPTSDSAPAPTSAPASTPTSASASTPTFASASTPAAANAPAPGRASASAPAFHARHASPDIVADTVMLFRYSALCFNGHRIHYDQPYATQAEGYPALVVNGGLSTLCVFEHLHQAWGRELEMVHTRNVAPLFQGETFRVESAPGLEAGTVDFRVITTEGKTALAGNAVFVASGARA
jgi:hydroxyacyl-ACP dehydratase HTD2-like protein with hotdog domain